MTGTAHLEQLALALRRLEGDLDRVDRWGRNLAAVLLGGGRLLAAGNGGSAAQAQHLTAELVGRYRDERRPLSAIALHADTSTLTAVVNDYGPADAFARSVRAHGRPGDVLLALSTSGRSPNVLEAAAAARAAGMSTLALTGRAPNPLVDVADDAICVDGDTPIVQEVHQVVIHLLCEAVDGVVLNAERAERADGEARADGIDWAERADAIDLADRADRSHRVDRAGRSQLVRPQRQDHHTGARR